MKIDVGYLGLDPKISQKSGSKSKHQISKRCLQIDNLRSRHLSDIICDNLFPDDASVAMKTNVFSMSASTRPCSRSNKLLVQRLF